MKRKVNKKNHTEVDNFERKQNKHLAKKEKRSKRRLSIYDEFDDEELDDYLSNNYDEIDEDDDY